jgi:uncharacterized protein (DUF58 family)
MFNIFSRLNRDAGNSDSGPPLDVDARVDDILRQSGEGFVAIGFRSRSYRTGSRRTIFTGPAGDFYKTAEYVPGEHEQRQIMPRATAKTGGRQKIVKICRPDAQTTVYMLADINRTLDFGHSRESKLELMARCAATVCLSLKETQDLVKAALYANESVAYSMSRAMVPTMAVRRIIREIIDPVHSTGKLSSGLEEAVRIVPAAGQREVVILSDFLNFTENQYQVLADLARLNNVRAVVIQDIRERELPNPGSFIPRPLKVFDMTTGRQVTWWLTDANRRKYTAEFERHEAGLKKFFEDNGIRYEFVRTDDTESVPQVIGLLSSPPLLS